jgi:hypothetical protein
METGAGPMCPVVLAHSVFLLRVDEIEEIPSQVPWIPGGLA